MKRPPSGKALGAVCCRNTDALTNEMTKAAGNVGLTYEIINDWPSFKQYCGQESYKQIIDQENVQILSGNGTAPNMEGFFNTPGILTHDCTSDTGTAVTVWDSLEKSLAQLRTGTALAEGDLWIRRVKDLMAGLWSPPIRQMIRSTKRGASTFWRRRNAH